MNDHEMESLGKTLAGALRHFPSRFNLDMDRHGWVSLTDFVRSLTRKQRRFKWVRPYHITALIETDPKGRYQELNGRIRATYGHSIDLDLDLPTDDIPEKLYFPTDEGVIDEILENGITKHDRKMVHLSGTYEAAMAAGRVRTRDPIILEVDAEGAIESGIIIMHAGKFVYITDAIPPEFLAIIKKNTEDEATEEEQPGEEQASEEEDEVPPEEKGEE
ncbi:RNA 2'-phosphotransferase [candidate division WOR-3 bacterium]|nr:RNA 2'-phosphotransferase [candidate division WOR-3 bacterium]